jgi:DNA-binding NtrC family response regulator
VLPSSAPLFTADDRTFLQAVVRLGHANPVSPARVEAERVALGAAFVDDGALSSSPENRARIAARLRSLLDAARPRLSAALPADSDDLALYQEACLYLLRDTHGERLQPLVDGRALPTTAATLHRALLDDHARLLAFPGSAGRLPSPEQIFASAFQLRRAYHFLSTMVGTSRPMQELRAAVWSAIFTRDLRGHLRTCDRKRSEISTLITGPSGTGKELVAGAIGRSLYRPYDVALGRFLVVPGADYCAVNPSAWSDTLFESELFGHERGAFTGALKDRKGLFETVSQGGALFLDEIGELALERQPKLLRVLQERVFHRVGDLSEHPFSARVISATHRDLSERVREGAFRLDLYQRLAALRIVTPSLRAQLDAEPGDLARLVRFFAERLADEEEASAALTGLALRHIEEHLPRYGWPGNVRELGHCVETLHHGGHFLPLELGGEKERARSSTRPASSSMVPPPSSVDPVRSLREGTLSEEEAIRRYRNIVFARTGSVSAAARRLGIHRNTLMRSLDRARVARWRARPSR